MLRRIYSNLLICAITLNIFYGFRAHGASLDCTFDHSFCEWNQETSDDFNWTRQNEYTKSSLTGPSSDHTIGESDGYYIYIETSHPRKKDDNAMLISPMQEPGPQCFMFWYSMYGSDIGTLNIYLVPNNTVIFTKSGDIGDRKWRTEAISYNAPVKSQIVIEGIRGQDTKDDIAIDDISMTRGICTLNCTFDSGLCLWKQDYTDDFDWIWKNGATTASKTGSLADHTSGHRNYIYIDSSKAGRNEKARVISPLMYAGKYCFSMWYYMNGEHVDTLRILQVEEEDETTELLVISRDQGKQWIRKMAFINSRMRFRIMIEGKTLNRYKRFLGDIVVDDIVMISCQDCANPKPIHGQTNATNFQYGSAIEITCNSGYQVRGKPSIICQSGGHWSTSTTCEPVDCGMRKITNGVFDAVSGTTFGQTATQSCESGYVLTGNAVVTCTEAGWNGGPATCTIVDCWTPTIANGKVFGTIERTTYNQMAVIACKDGYELLGNPNVTCQADGNWTSLPACIMMDSENHVMVAVYVLVPVIVVALVITFLAVTLRQKAMECLSALCANREHEMKAQPHSVSLFTNATYSGHQNEMRSNPDSALSQDPEYAIIIGGRNRKVQDEKAVYYNTVDALITEQENVEDNYDHTKSSQTPVFDNTYSHVSGNTENCESNYNTASVSYPENGCFQTDSYDVLDTKGSKQDSGTKLPSNMQDDQDSEYDHANTGGNVTTDVDNYSHLNDKTVKQL